MNTFSPAVLKEYLGAKARQMKSLSQERTGEWGMRGRRRREREREGEDDVWTKGSDLRQVLEPGCGGLPSLAWLQSKLASVYPGKDEGQPCRSDAFTSLQ